MLAATPGAVGKRRARLRNSARLIGIVELQACGGPAYDACSGVGSARSRCGLIDLAALEGCVGTEGATDDLLSAWRIDDEQRQTRIKTALDQVVDECLHDGGVLGAPDQGERMLWLPSMPRAATSTRCCDVQPVDLDDQEVQLGQVRRHPLGQPFCGQGHEPARGR